MSELINSKDFYLLRVKWLALKRFYKVLTWRLMNYWLEVMERDRAHAKRGVSLALTCQFALLWRDAN
ncbi:hypothetical protein [Trichocoleus sp. ST-U1]|uniref:hypothetical protein n=1 Tax=Trichocoleus sp. ST-U1 TaxID=2933928 RepID=UPI00329A42B1